MVYKRNINCDSLNPHHADQLLCNRECGTLSNVVKRKQKQIAEEAEARGIVYISSEERAAMEQEEQDRKAEEKRIEELHERCRKKGLNFDEEEAKYQKKLADKKAKEEAKRKKKESRKKESRKKKDRNL